MFYTRYSVSFAVHRLTAIKNSALEGGRRQYKFFPPTGLSSEPEKLYPHVSGFQHEDKADSIFAYYNNILGVRFSRQQSIDLQVLNLPRLQLQELDVCFSEQEIRGIIHETPGDRAPGTDGFNGRFLKMAWDVIKTDIVSLFHA